MIRFLDTDGDGAMENGGGRLPELKEHKHHRYITVTLSGSGLCGMDVAINLGLNIPYFSKKASPI